MSKRGQIEIRYVGVSLREMYSMKKQDNNQGRAERQADRIKKDTPTAPALLKVSMMVAPEQTA